MKRVMLNKYGKRIEIKEGFSWITFFFGVFVLLIRGDFKWLVIMLLADLLPWKIFRKNVYL